MPTQAHPRYEILRIEKKIFRLNQQTITDATDVTEEGFKPYYRRYKKAIKSYQRVSDIDTALKDIEKSRVVLVGDYHTLDQSQRSFVRVLRSFMRKKHKRVVVALETLQHKHQKWLSQFLEGSLDHEAFVKKIGFKQHWFFDLYRNYEVIFDFLKYHKIPTFAVDADAKNKPTLLERDAYMANRLKELCEEHPDSIIFLLVGDLHLAPEHLPRKIESLAKKTKTKMPAVTLYQNSPEIYWKLLEKGLIEHTLVTKVGAKQYCRMHTPPIIVQQSYINWLYHEDEGFDWVDARLSFLQLIKRMAKILKLKLPEDYEDVTVYTCGDLSFLEVLEKKKLFSKKELKFIRFQILNSQSYFLPRARMIYVANVSIHHAAEEGSHYLKFLFSGLEGPRSHKDAFYANVLHEAVGFFGSKLINNKRKCPRNSDFAAELRYLDRSQQMVQNHVEYETAQLFIEHYKNSKKGKLIHTNKVMSMSQELFLSITHALGYDLGDLLYYGFMAQKISIKDIQDLYCKRYDAEGEPGQVYLHFKEKLKGVKRPKLV